MCVHMYAQCDLIPQAKPWHRDLEVQGECRSQRESSTSHYLLKIFHGSPGVIVASASRWFKPRANCPASFTFHPSLAHFSHSGPLAHPGSHQCCSHYYEHPAPPLHYPSDFSLQVTSPRKPSLICPSQDESGRSLGSKAISFYWDGIWLHWANVCV